MVGRCLDFFITLGSSFFAITSAYVEPLDMLAELRDDNKTVASSLREAHSVRAEHRDIATASLIEVWIDETERRTWFLFEASRRGDSTGH